MDGCASSSSCAINVMPRAFAAAISASLVGRTTAIVVGFSLFVGGVFASISVPVLHAREEVRLQARIGELASTVASTVSVACYLEDATLAQQVASGLLTNRSIDSVRIVAGSEVLASMTRNNDVQRGRSHSPVVRAVASPFDAARSVGRLELVPAEHEIRREASAYARYIGLLLAAQVAALAALVSHLVLRSIVRPIKNISDDLHRLEMEHGGKLMLPPGNEHNEIGRLARDVNTLVDKLVGLLDSEREQRRERERSERQFRLIFEHVENGIFIATANGALISWNPALARELHVSSDAQSPQLDVLLAPHADNVRALLRRSMDTGLPTAAELELRGPTGHRWLSLLIQPLELDLVQGMIQDVTSHKRAQAEALALAHNDALTGALNRRGMEHELGNLLRTYIAGRQDPFCLFMIDLDWFKQVNDVHGHDAGDAVLRTVTTRLRAMTRPGDVVARLGGDEFVLILPAVQDLDLAKARATALIESISQPIPLSSGAIARVGATIGISRSEAFTLMRSADRAMYAAKQAGKSRYCIDPALTTAPAIQAAS
jgi:diguanylate cyclase (GGDEF)-like protein/PAS domain S-box-containing protein